MSGRREGGMVAGDIFPRFFHIVLVISCSDYVCLIILFLPITTYLENSKTIDQ